MIEYRKTDDVAMILNLVNKLQHIPNDTPLTSISGIFFGAYDGDVLVGVGGYMIKGKNSNTTYLTVMNTYAGQGIDEELHRLRVADAKANGCTQISTILVSNRELKWYLKHTDYEIVRVGRAKTLRQTFVGDNLMEAPQVISEYSRKKRDLK